MKKKILILLCLILVIFSVGSVSAVDDLNQTITEDDVDYALDVSSDEIVETADDGTFTALQNKIDNASENSTITLENDYSHDEGFSTDGVYIDKPLTIDGNGHTMNGDNVGRIFTINSSDVILNNMVFSNGYSKSGGVIYSENSNISIVNCKFEDNVAFVEAGSCFFKQCNVTIINSTFMNNSAFRRDMGTFTELRNEINNIEAGGVLNLTKDYMYDDNLTEITLNKKITINGQGHTIYGKRYGPFYAAAKNVVLNNITFITYYSEIYSKYDDVKTVNCRFEDSIYFAAGAFYSENSNVSLIMSTFRNNFAKVGGVMASCGSFISIINSSFTDNSAGEDGGVIYSDNDLGISISDSSFVNNSANGDGGLLYGCENYYSISPVSIANSSFVNNSANDEGGVAYSVYGMSVCAFNSSFVNNYAAYGGVIFYEYGYDITVLNSLFVNNSAVYGGAIYSRAADLLVSNSTFINNSAEGAYGAICFSSVEYSPDLSIVHSTFIGNSAKFAGALSIGYQEYADPGFVISNKNANLIDNIFIDNHADECGAIEVSGNLNISDSVFESNHADSIGSIMIESGKINIRNCSFSNNTNGNILFSFYRDYTDSLEPGKLTIDKSSYAKSVTLDNNLKSISLIKVSVNKVNTFYKSGKLLQIKLVNKYTKKPVAGYFTLKAGSKSYTLYSNSKGIATFKASNLNVGKYSVVISPKKYDNYLPMDVAYSTITIKKASTVVKAPKVVNKFKKSKYFKVTVKSNKKAVKNLKIKVKVFTGKKYKIFTVKTNSKGVAKLNTKSLKTGKHKVIIYTANKNYKVSAKSKITIKK